MLEDFWDEGECLFGVVASEVLNLREDLLVVEWQEFVEKERGVVPICLSEVGEGLELDEPLFGVEA